MGTKMERYFKVQVVGVESRKVFGQGKIIRQSWQCRFAKSQRQLTYRILSQDIAS